MPDKKMPRGEDFIFEMTPEVEEQLKADPKLASAVREIQARMRQALDGVATGQFANAEEAMRSIGAKPTDLAGDDQ